MDRCPLANESLSVITQSLGTADFTASDTLNKRLADVVTFIFLALLLVAACNTSTKRLPKVAPLFHVRLLPPSSDSFGLECEGRETGHDTEESRRQLRRRRRKRKLTKEDFAIINEEWFSFYRDELFAAKSSRGIKYFKETYQLRYTPWKKTQIINRSKRVRFRAFNDIRLIESRSKIYRLQNVQDEWDNVVFSSTPKNDGPAGMESLKDQKKQEKTKKSPKSILKKHHRTSCASETTSVNPLSQAKDEGRCALQLTPPLAKFQCVWEPEIDQQPPHKWEFKRRFQVPRVKWQYPRRAQ